MIRKRIRDDARLLRVARAIVEELRTHRNGGPLRLRWPKRVASVYTDGWSVVIGNLGYGQPSMVIWLDRFTGHGHRNFYAGFDSNSEQMIRRIAFASKTLWPIREVTEEDMLDGSSWALKRRLPKTEFDSPVLETYHNSGEYFFGIFHASVGDESKVNVDLRDEAVAFFLDVAGSTQASLPDERCRDVYPQYENRKHVNAHLARERSRLLALRCKQRDNYCCQICTLCFEDQYGSLGRNFAEAHHKKPLGALPEKVRSSLADLITVCANCHRMLHRMDGCPEDIPKLKRIVRKHLQ